MSGWGNQNVPVTVNSSTTFETTLGAPIDAAVNARWGADNTSIAVTANNADLGNTSPGSKALADLQFFNNTTVNAYITNMAVGIFGISTNQIGSAVATQNTYAGAHAGWTIVRQGTGGRAGRIQAETLVAMGTLGDYTAPDLLIGTDVLLSPDSKNLVTTF